MHVHSRIRLTLAAILLLLSILRSFDPGRIYVTLRLVSLLHSGTLTTPSTDSLYSSGE